MLGDYVVTILVLIDRSVVWVTVLLAWMLRFATRCQHSIILRVAWWMFHLRHDGGGSVVRYGSLFHRFDEAIPHILRQLGTLPGVSSGGILEKNIQAIGAGD